MNKFTKLILLGAVKAQTGEDLLYAETRSPGTSEDRVFTMPLDPVGEENERSLQGLYDDTASTQDPDEEPVLAETLTPVGPSDDTYDYEEVENTTFDVEFDSTVGRGGSSSASSTYSYYSYSPSYYSYSYYSYSY